MKSAGWSDKSLESREEFSLFCYRLHDEVNKMLGKTSPPFEEIRDKYEMLRAKCLSNEEKMKLTSENKELDVCVLNTMVKEENVYFKSFLQTHQFQVLSLMKNVLHKNFES